MIPKSGIILLNKQAGRTSHDEVVAVKRALRKLGMNVKVGHSGTLDPKVTGLLVVGYGKGTKVLEYMLMSEKQYVGEIIFHDHVTKAQLEEVIEEFLGKIRQLPPRKSSVKRVEREREVYGLEIKDFDYEHKKATLFCAVERGTYIRKLFHDMGEYLGVRAHMGDLHRVKVGPFSEKDRWVSAGDLEILAHDSTRWNLFKRMRARKKLRTQICPLTSAVPEPQFRKVVLKPGVEKYITSGNDVFVPGVKSVDSSAVVGDYVTVFDSWGRLVAIGTLTMSRDSIRSSKRGIAIKTEKVLL